MAVSNTGDSAWVIISGILVMLMAMGTALFYGGLGNKKNVLTIVGSSMLVFCTAALTWGLLGFSLSFGNKTVADGFIGDCSYCGLRNIVMNDNSIYSGTLPFASFFFFETMLAAIAPTILSTSIIGRIRLSFLLLLTICYIIIVYSPIAYWVWNKNGWLNKMGVIDFAGGLVIHIPAGFACLASMHYLGSFHKMIEKPKSYNLTISLIGIALIWFGWFGFNGGSAFNGGLSAAVASINTLLAAGSGALTWTVIQYILTQRPTVLGWCCGLICALVGITPCSGFVNLWASIVIGSISAGFSYLYCHFKSKKIQELPVSIDIFGCYGISGVWGGIAAGIFATTDSGNTVDGLFYGQGKVFGVNVLGVVVCAIYSFAMTQILYFLLGRLLQPKVSEFQQEQGFDINEYSKPDQMMTARDVVKIIKSLNANTSLGHTQLNTYENIEPGTDTVIRHQVQISTKNFVDPEAKDSKSVHRRELIQAIEKQLQAKEAKEAKQKNYQ